MRNNKLSRVLVCVAVIVSISTIGAARTSVAVGCENAETYVQRFVGSDFIVGPSQCEGGLLWMTVSNVWYGFACHEREQLYIVVRDGWRAQNGTNIIFRDIVGTTVADFRVFSSTPRIKDC